MPASRHIPSFLLSGGGHLNPLVPYYVDRLYYETSSESSAGHKDDPVPDVEEGWEDDDAYPVCKWCPAAVLTQTRDSEFITPRDLYNSNTTELDDRAIVHNNYICMVYPNKTTDGPQDVAIMPAANYTLRRGNWCTNGVDLQIPYFVPGTGCPAELWCIPRLDFFAFFGDQATYANLFGATYGLFANYKFRVEIRQYDYNTNNLLPGVIHDFPFDPNTQNLKDLVFSRGLDFPSIDYLKGVAPKLQIIPVRFRIKYFFTRSDWAGLVYTDLAPPQMYPPAHYPPPAYPVGGTTHLMMDSGSAPMCMFKRVYTSMHSDWSWELSRFNRFEGLGWTARDSSGLPAAPNPRLVYNFAHGYANDSVPAVWGSRPQFGFQQFRGVNALWDMPMDDPFWEAHKGFKCGIIVHNETRPLDAPYEQGNIAIKFDAADRIGYIKPTELVDTGSSAELATALTNPLFFRSDNGEMGMTWLNSSYVFQDYDNSMSTGVCVIPGGCEWICHLVRKPSDESSKIQPIGLV